MRGLIQRAITILREEGGIELLKRSVSHIYGRQLTKTGIISDATYNNVRIRKSYLPWENVDLPTYESGLVEGIRKWVDDGDSVLIIGGGRGITAVHAAKQVGSAGSVVVYEASDSSVDTLSNTIQINQVSNIIEIRHALVGPDIHVYGETNEASTINVQELPPCDVLELDCEGAELEILKNLQQSPRVILVESHGMHGASSKDIKKILINMGYDIHSEVVATDANREFCLENDIMAISATKTPMNSD